MATKKRPIKKKRPDCAESARAFIRRAEVDPPFESVDVDLEPETEDDWKDTYAIVSYALSPHEEEFFDDSECKSAFYQFVRSCFPDPDFNFVVRDGSPARPYVVGDTLVIVDWSEIEVYRLEQKDVDLLEKNAKRKADAQAKSRKEARR